MSDDLCGRCGAPQDGPHVWVDGDCVLPHRTHARASGGLCCPGCKDRLCDWLSEIVDLFEDLPRVIPLGSVPDNTQKHKHTHATVSPAMMRLDAWSMAKDRARLRHTGSRADVPNVPFAIAGPALHLHHDLGTAPAEPYGDQPGPAASYLVANIDDLAHYPWVVEFDADLRWVRSHLRRAHGIADARPLGRCMSVTETAECGGWVMPSTDQDQRPCCTRCRRRYGPLDLVRLKVSQA